MSGRNGRAGLGKGMNFLAALILGFLSMGSIGGCITINIYFPAAAAEKAADRIIDDVLGSGKGSGDAPAK